MSVSLPEQIITFNLDGVLFAIGVADIQEILPTVACRSLPDTSAYVQGLMTFRGDVIPLLNLGILLNLSPSLTQGSTIILRQNERHIGLMVDGVDEVVTGSTNIKELPITDLRVDGKFVSGVIEYADKAVVVLNQSEIIRSLEV